MRISVPGSGGPTVSAQRGLGSSGLVWVRYGEASVWPKPIVTATPSCSRARRTSSGATGAPPSIDSRQLETSRGRAACSSSIRMSIVGTLSISVPRSASNSSSIRAGSKPAGSTCVPPVCSAPRVASPQPAVWNIGIGLIHTSSGPASFTSANMRLTATRPRWGSIAPLGKPVVPDVYWIWAMSPGATSGRGTSSADATNSSHRERSTTSRSPGKSGRVLSTTASRSVPRCCGWTRTPQAWDWRRTCASSAARYAGLTVTRVSPANAAPNSTRGHSGRLAAQIAMCSPGR
jgi:hypothetical protein